MNKTARIAVVAALLAVIGVVMAVRQKNTESSRAGQEGAEPAATKPLPRLVDLGAGKCIPCRKMAPILEELKKEFAGRLEVEFIDVWENPSAGERYGVKLIPTQIFFDAAGKELFRHEGFYSREDILGKWKELGVDLALRPASAVASETGVAQ